MSSCGTCGRCEAVKGVADAAAEDEVCVTVAVDVGRLVVEGRLTFEEGEAMVENSWRMS